MNRRRFIQNTALTMTTIGSGLKTAGAAAAGAPTKESQAAPGDALIDTHVFISRWPFRRVPGDESAQHLAEKLQSRGVTEAWVGSFDALLHRDIAAVNARLAEECAAQRDVRFLPFGAVNPMLPDWEDDLRRCHEQYRMKGIRLHPDFHGYALNDPRFERLLDLATQRRMVVQIGLGMEDPRLQAPLGKVPPANPAPLADVLPKYAQAKVVLLNFWRTYRNNRVLQVRLNSLPQVCFDLATMEMMAGIEEALQEVPGLRLVFGSYAPFYNFGSSWRKLEESMLSPEVLAAIRHGEARRMIEAA